MEVYMVGFHRLQRIHIPDSGLYSSVVCRLCLRRFAFYALRVMLKSNKSPLTRLFGTICIGDA